MWTVNFKRELYVHIVLGNGLNESINFYVLSEAEHTFCNNKQ